MTWMSTEKDLIIAQHYGLVPARELAERLGAPSKSALISRARALGLSVTKEQRSENKSKAQRTINRLKRGAQPEAPIPVRRPVVRLRMEPRAQATPPIMRFDECQWINGDTGGSHWHKCGQKTREGSAWCEEHYARCYGRGQDD